MTSTEPATPHRSRIAGPGPRPARPGSAPRPGRVWPARVTVAVVLLALAAVPLLLAPYATSTMTRILVFALLAMSLDLLVGVTGLPSLGHAAYFGVGAYTTGLLMIHVSPSAPLALLAGTAAGGLAAAATGWVAVRSAGIFFLMLTLAIGEVIHQLAESWDSVTGGANGLYGIPAVTLGGTTLTNVGLVYWFVLAGVLVGAAVLLVVSRSPFGATLRGIRDNEARMRALGYRPFSYKYAAFVLAGSVAGLAGALLAVQERLVTPDDLGFLTAALALLAVVIGGAGTLWGAVLGAALVVLVRENLGQQLQGHGALVLGAVFIAAVYLLPRGFAGLRRRRRPAAEAPGETS